jgi:hypothetical protein
MWKLLVKAFALRPFLNVVQAPLGFCLYNLKQISGSIHYLRETTNMFEYKTFIKHLCESGFGIQPKSELRQEVLCEFY